MFVSLSQFVYNVLVCVWTRICGVINPLPASEAHAYNIFLLHIMITFTNNFNNLEYI